MHPEVREEQAVTICQITLEMRGRFLLMPEFIDDEIKVHFTKKPGHPTSFTWRETEYRIVGIKDVRRNLDFREAWWRRRHRDYYVVKTDTDETLEIYFNRGPGRKYWVLYKKLEG